MKYPIYWPQYLTATILEWKKLLIQDKYKDFIKESLHFLVQEKRIELNAFVIMSNHLHLIWQPLNDQTPEKIQHSLMSFTAHKFKTDLEENHLQVLAHFKVEAKDRSYQFWERNSLGIDLVNETMFIQKLNYIHQNPVVAGLCLQPEDYHYSSATFYENGIDDFEMLTHWRG